MRLSKCVVLDLDSYRLECTSRICLIFLTVDSAANASIREDGDRICVNCSDVDDGESKGCVVVVHSNQTLESAMSYKIPLFTEKCFPQEGGEYTVAVFRQNMSNVLRQVPVNVSVVSIRVPTLTPTTCKSGEVTHVSTQL